MDIDSRGVCVFILFRGEGRWSSGKCTWCDLGTRPVMRLLFFCFYALGILGVYVSSKETYVLLEQNTLDNIFTFHDVYSLLHHVDMNSPPPL